MLYHLNNSRHIIFSLLILCFFSACKEKAGYVIDYGCVFQDEKFMDLENLPAPQDKVVLVEEFTGVNCQNCPSGARILKEIAEKHPERMAIIGVHALDAFTKHPYTQEAMFKTEVGESLAQAFDVAALPIAAIDRINEDNNRVFQKEIWESKINVRLEQTTPINIYIHNQFDSQSEKLTTDVELRYIEDINEEHYVSVVLLENGIIDFQNDNGLLVDDYEHNHVLRNYMTALSGREIEAGNKNRGSVYIKTFGLCDKMGNTLAIPSEYQIENCEILAFVHKGSGPYAEVVHAQLKGIFE